MFSRRLIALLIYVNIERIHIFIIFTLDSVEMKCTLLHSAAHSPARHGEMKLATKTVSFISFIFLLCSRLVLCFMRINVAIDLNFVLAHVVCDVCVDSNAVFGKRFHTLL